MKKLKTAEEGWLEFSSMTLKDASDEELHSAKLIFYSGYFASISFACNVIEDSSSKLTDEASTLLLTRCAECAYFIINKKVPPEIKGIGK